MVARAVAATRQDVVVRDTLAMRVLHRLDVAEVLILAAVASQAAALLTLSPSTIARATVLLALNP